MKKFTLTILAASLFCGCQKPDPRIADLQNRIQRLEDLQKQNEAELDRLSNYTISNAALIQTVAEEGTRLTEATIAINRVVKKIDVRTGGTDYQQ